MKFETLLEGIIFSVVGAVVLLVDVYIYLYIFILQPAIYGFCPHLNSLSDALMGFPEGSI